MIADGWSRRRLGLPAVGIVGLALLGVPRVVAHDLGPVGPTLNAVLLFAPIAVWLGVVCWLRVPNAFATLLAVGVVYGVLLGAAHQLLWVQAFDGAPPRLGGTLAGVMAPWLEDIVMRAFAVASSVLTGAVLGALTGAVGWVIARVVPGFRPRERARTRP